MNWGLLLILAGGVLIAYANGSNDVSKGIATLVGGGATSYKRAVLWGTVCTGLGGLAGVLLAQAMVETFGAGLLAEGTSPTLAATLAMMAGAGLWVAIATRTGLPVSTTHAIVGSIAGVGTLAYGTGGFNWTALGSQVALPLLLSPLVALLVTVAVLKTWNFVAARLPGGESDCVCVDAEPAWTMAEAGPNVARVSLAAAAPRVIVASEKDCAVEAPRAARVTLNHLHWLTSGAVSFSRGLNDAPKMVALVLAAGAVSAADSAMDPWAFVLVTLGMVAGSWMAGRRVTRVLAEEVTPMDHREAFVANLVTAAMVGPGASLGLPMSTTHVSSGTIMGLGSQGPGPRQKARLNWRTVRNMLLAWVVTLPLAAALGMAVYGCLRLLS